MSAPSLRRTSTVAVGSAASAASKAVLTDEVLQESFLVKGAIPDVKKFLLLVSGDKAPSQAKFRKILQFVLEALKTESVSAELQTAMDDDAEIATVFTGLHYLLTSAIKCRVKEKEFANALKDFLLPQPVADDLIRALSVSRESLEVQAAAPTIDFPTVEQTRWRTDVTISTASLERVFRPTVMMQLTLSNGEIKQFECSPERFQELRYHAALVLRNMQSLAKHPTLIMNAEQQ